MTPTDQDNILRLIAATIFADRYVYESEVDVFVSATCKLKSFKGVKPKLTQVRLRKWYALNKAEIEQKVSAPYFKDWLYELLEALKNVSGQDHLLEVMNKISLADGHVHINERSLIMLAKRHWGLL